HSSRAGDIDVDIVLVFRIDEQRVRVRPAAGLHIGDVLRVVDVADVEDANAAQALLADRVLHALAAAIEASAGCFARNEEEVLVDGNVALRSWAVVRRLERHLGRVLDIPYLEAVVATLNCVWTDEREVGIGAANELGRWRIG